MKITLMLILSLFAASNVIAQDKDDKDDKAKAKTETEAPKEEATAQEGRYIKDLSAKEKHQLEDQLAAEVVAEHNAETESDLDEVVCKKVTVTGSRQKKRLCRTKREIQQEEASTRQMMRMRNRSSSVPPLPTNASPR